MFPCFYSKRVGTKDSFSEFSQIIRLDKSFKSEGNNLNEMSSLRLCEKHQENTPIKYPFKPHFYMVKLEFIGDTSFFIFLLNNIDCGYSLELPQ